MYLIQRRGSNQRNFDGFDFDVFAGQCQNRTYNDVVVPDNESDFPSARIVLNDFSRNQLFIPRAMINPVVSGDIFSKIKGMAPIVSKEINVVNAYRLECPTGMSLDDFIAPGEDSSVLYQRLVDNYGTVVPDQDFFEIICIRRPVEYPDICDGSKIVSFHEPGGGGSEVIDIPKTLVDYFGIVSCAGLFFRDDVFEAIREHINENIFTIQHS